MSKIKPQNATVKTAIRTFGGMRRSADCGETAARDIRNFRVGADGSLEKRNGRYRLFSFGGTVRGVWQGSLNGEYFRIAVTDGGVFAYDPIGGTQRRIAPLNTTAGDVSFVTYCNELYLLDGDSIYRYRNGLLSPAEGMVPLYGRDWHPRNGGEVLHSVNLLSRRLIVHYLNLTGESRFTLPFAAESIDCLLINSQPSTAFSFTAGQRYLTLSSPSVGDQVEIAFTLYGSSDSLAELQSARLAHCFVGSEGEELYLYGTPRGYRIWGSSRIEDEELAYARRFYPNADPLYFTAENKLLAGDAENPVMALCPYRDRIFAWHAKGASVILTNKDGTRVCYPVYCGNGCNSPFGVISFEGEMVAVNHAGVCRFRSSASDPDGIRPVLLSAPIEGMLPASLAENAILAIDPAHRELWIRGRDDGEGLVWVWNAGSDAWYRFDGITAQLFFTEGGQIGYASGRHLHLFSPGLYTDEGEVFAASYQSGYSDMELCGGVKRSGALRICADVENSRLSLTLATERGQKTVSNSAPGGDAPIHMSLRDAPGRFRFAGYMIREESEHPSRIYHALLTCNQ